MSYDPFARGAFPVGVRTLELEDEARGRDLTVELWYPAADAHAGEDLDEASQDRFSWLPALAPARQQAVRNAAHREGRFPLVLFSHGFGGHRRQTTHLCTHLASHGYVVAAVDHTGNTLLDVLQQVTAQRDATGQIEPRALLESPINDRPRDVSFVIDTLLDGGAGGITAQVDAARVGATGHSFGGWTTLMVAGRDRRISAALPLAPAGGSSPFAADLIGQSLDLEWDRDVPTLYLVAENDTVLLLEGMHRMLESTRGRKRMVVLKNSDHFHFCDRVEEVHELYRLSLTLMPPGLDSPGAAARVRPAAEHCPGEQAYLYLRGLGLAHMDAHLKQLEPAAELLAGDLAALLAARGVLVDVV